MPRLERTALLILAGGVALISAACSGTPPPAAAPVAKLEASPSVAASWLCAAKPRKVSLPMTGLPPDSRLIDEALSADKVTLLFRPARIVVLSRSDTPSVDVIVGDSQSSWSAIDRDPTDDSLWVASDDNVSLLRIAATGERRVVTGPRVAGRGGFRQIRVTRSEIYATPTAADNEVWRLSREGKVLGQAFPHDPAGDELAIRDPGRRDFWLARDLAGSIAGFDLRTGEVFIAQDDGTWSPRPERFPARPRSDTTSLHGDRIGTRSETWYVTDRIRGFFFLPEGPALLGSSVAGTHSSGSVLFRLHDGKLETATEDCTPGTVSLVATDASGFAAVTSELQTRTSTGLERTQPSELLLAGFPAGR
jgi:hypothetical protein